MRFDNYNNKNCLRLKDIDGEVTPFQLLIVGASGHGKGTSSEAIVERWKRATKGIVIFLNDPKLEAEQSFVMYEPTEQYHLRQLKRDGIKKSSYPAKLYHPYTHNISKRGYIPEINFYTLSIKDMTRGDWSILAESEAESETIKLLERVAEKLERNASLFDFLGEIERLTEGKKNKSRAVADPDNWLLRSGGGTAKSVKMVGNLLSSFEKDYFLRKDTCPYKLDWEKVLTDSDNYHVFLSNWIENPKLRNFLVEVLMGQAIREAQRLSNIGKLKKPILFVIPELINVCPDESTGSSYYLSKALRKSLVAMRSQAGGISCIADTQIWSQTSPLVRSAFNQTFYGRLNPEDARVIFKSNQYGTSSKELFQEIEENAGSFVWFKQEQYGVFSIFMPSHMHKEVKYNWIQTYKKYFPEKMKNYDWMVKIMRSEFQQEFTVRQAEIEKEERLIEESEKQKEKDNITPKDSNPEKESEVKTNLKVVDKSKAYIMQRAWELHEQGMSNRAIAREMKIKSHKTVKKYYEEHKKILEQSIKEESNKTFEEKVLKELDS